MKEIFKKLFGGQGLAESKQQNQVCAEHSDSLAGGISCKTQVYNVVILDRSGSMADIQEAAVSGFNEIVGGIRSAQKQFADTQAHFVTLVTFCCCKTEYVYDRVAIDGVKPLTLDGYRPCCYTPLLDAMGLTLTKLRSFLTDKKDYAVVVTVITDGLENASVEFRLDDINMLVSELRAAGWSFSYMGANQDAIKVASSMNIRNARCYAYSRAGVKECMDTDRAMRESYFTGLDRLKKEEKTRGISFSDEQRSSRLNTLSEDSFDAV